MKGLTGHFLGLFLGCLMFAQVSEKKGEEIEPAVPPEQLRAVALSQEITTEVRRIDRAGGVYSEEFVKKIGDFYRYGTGSEFFPDDSRIVKKFCRANIIAQLRTIFQLNSHLPPEPSDYRFQNYPTKDSRLLFRDLLEGFLPSALEDLELGDRIRFYRLAGNLLTPDDVVGSKCLIQLAIKVEQELKGRQDSGEVSAIWMALDLIKARAKNSQP